MHGLRDLEISRSQWFKGIVSRLRLTCFPRIFFRRAGIEMRCSRLPIAPEHTRTTLCGPAARRRTTVSTMAESVDKSGWCVISCTIDDVTLAAWEGMVNWSTSRPSGQRHRLRTRHCLSWLRLYHSPPTCRAIHLSISINLPNTAITPTLVWRGCYSSVLSAQRLSPSGFSCTRPAIVCLGPHLVIFIDTQYFLTCHVFFFRTFRLAPLSYRRNRPRCNKRHLSTTMVCFFLLNLSARE
jgi:hypothetical protein